MKIIISALLLAITLGCSTSARQTQNKIYDKEFRTVFQASLSALKDRRFTIKSYDWNSGEIDSYKKSKEGEKNKEVRATVSLEQINQKTKVRINVQQSEESTLIAQSEIELIEREFFVSLDNAINNIPRN
jgi:hypothetical protein